MIDTLHALSDAACRLRVQQTLTRPGSHIKVVVATFVGFGAYNQVSRFHSRASPGVLGSAFAYWQEMGCAGKDGHPTVALTYMKVAVMYSQGGFEDQEMHMSEHPVLFLGGLSWIRLQPGGAVVAPTVQASVVLSWDQDAEGTHCSVALLCLFIKLGTVIPSLTEAGWRLNASMNWVILVQVTAYCLFGAKPLPELMQLYCQLVLRGPTSVKLKSTVSSNKKYRNLLRVSLRIQVNTNRNWLK